MTKDTRRFLFWVPRALCLSFAALISLFAFDVFEPGRSPWQIAGALTMHLLPTVLVLGVLALSWRWEWVGGLAFLGLGALYIVWSWGKFGWTAPALIAGPLFLIGALFLAGWVWRKEIRAPLAV